jgi:1-acyl-sn-glycerol-3-phosphate acyltransferase
VLRLVYTVWLRYRARGIEKIPATGGALLIANHQSFLDPLLVGLPLSRPVSYVARDSLFRVPFVGWVVRNTYVIPINREAASTATIREAVNRMRNGFLVGIFPEGTRTADGSVGTFKPGFLSLLRRGGVPVYPVGIAGSYEAMPRGRLAFRPSHVRVVYGDPIPVDEVRRLVEDSTDEELIAEIRRRVLTCAEEAETWRLEGL